MLINTTRLLVLCLGFYFHTSANAAEQWFLDGSIWRTSSEDFSRFRAVLPLEHSGAGHGFWKKSNQGWKLVSHESAKGSVQVRKRGMAIVGPKVEQATPVESLIQSGRFRRIMTFDSSTEQFKTYWPDHPEQSDLQWVQPGEGLIVETLQANSTLGTGEPVHEVRGGLPIKAYALPSAHIEVPKHIQAGQSLFANLQVHAAGRSISGALIAILDEAGNLLQNVDAGHGHGQSHLVSNVELPSLPPGQYTLKLQAMLDGKRQTLQSASITSEARGLNFKKLFASLGGQPKAQARPRLATGSTDVSNAEDFRALPETSRFSQTQLIEVTVTGPDFSPRSFEFTPDTTSAIIPMPIGNQREVLITWLDSSNTAIRSGKATIDVPISGAPPVQSLTPVELPAPEPRVSPAPGAFAQNLEITLEPGATTLFYTLNGENPRQSESTLQTTEPVSIQLSQSTTVLAFTRTASGAESGVFAFPYLWAPRPKATTNVTADQLIGNQFADTLTLELRSNTQDTSVFYTLDGSTPTQQSQVASLPLTLEFTDTFQIAYRLANRYGIMSSPVTTSYTVTTLPDTSLQAGVDVLQGQFLDSTTLQFTAQNGASHVRYSLDGELDSPQAQTLSLPATLTLTQSREVIYQALSSQGFKGLIAADSFTRIEAPNLNLVLQTPAPEGLLDNHFADALEIGFEALPASVQTLYLSTQSLTPAASDHQLPPGQSVTLTESTTVSYQARLTSGHLTPVQSLFLTQSKRPSLSLTAPGSINGVFQSAGSITLSADINGTKGLYTLDGSLPQLGVQTPVNLPVSIPITENTTIQAMGINPDGFLSDVVEEEIQVEEPPDLSYNLVQLPGSQKSGNDFVQSVGIQFQSTQPLTRLRVSSSGLSPSLTTLSMPYLLQVTNTQTLYFQAVSNAGFLGSEIQMTLTSFSLPSLSYITPATATANEFVEAVNVEFFGNSGNQIQLTLNGSDPSFANPQTLPLTTTLSDTATLRFRPLNSTGAFHGIEESLHLTRIATPSLSVSLNSSGPLLNDYFVEPVEVSLQAGGSTSTLLYTTNGTDPMAHGQAYATPFTVVTTTQIRAVGVSASGIPGPKQSLTLHRTEIPVAQMSTVPELSEGRFLETVDLHLSADRTSTGYLGINTHPNLSATPLSLPATITLSQSAEAILIASTPLGFHSEPVSLTLTREQLTQPELSFYPATGISQVIGNQFTESVTVEIDATDSGTSELLITESGASNASFSTSLPFQKTYHDSVDLTYQASTPGGFNTTAITLSLQQRTLPELDYTVQGERRDREHAFDGLLEFSFTGDEPGMMLEYEVVNAGQAPAMDFTATSLPALVELSASGSVYYQFVTTEGFESAAPQSTPIYTYLPPLSDFSLGDPIGSIHYARTPTPSFQFSKAATQSARLLENTTTPSSFELVQTTTTVSINTPNPLEPGKSYLLEVQLFNTNTPSLVEARQTIEVRHPEFNLVWGGEASGLRYEYVPLSGTVWPTHDPTTNHTVIHDTRRGRLLRIDSRGLSETLTYTRDVSNHPRLDGVELPAAAGETSYWFATQNASDGPISLKAWDGSGSATALAGSLGCTTLTALNGQIHDQISTGYCLGTAATNVNALAEVSQRLYIVYNSNLFSLSTTNTEIRWETGPTNSVASPRDWTTLQQPVLTAERIDANTLFVTTVGAANEILLSAFDVSTGTSTEIAQLGGGSIADYADVMDPAQVNPNDVSSAAFADGFAWFTAAGYLYRVDSTSQVTQIQNPLHGYISGLPMKADAARLNITAAYGAGNHLGVSFYDVNSGGGMALYKPTHDEFLYLSGDTSRYQKFAPHFEVLGHGGLFTARETMADSYPATELGGQYPDLGTLEPYVLQGNVQFDEFMPTTSPTGTWMMQDTAEPVLYRSGWPVNPTQPVPESMTQTQFEDSLSTPELMALNPLNSQAGADTYDSLGFAVDQGFNLQQVALPDPAISRYSYDPASDKLHYAVFSHPQEGAILHFYEIDLSVVPAPVSQVAIVPVTPSGFNFELATPGGTFSLDPTLISNIRVVNDQIYMSHSGSLLQIDALNPSNVKVLACSTLDAINQSGRCSTSTFHASVADYAVQDEQDILILGYLNPGSYELYHHNSTSLNSLGTPLQSDDVPSERFDAMRYAQGELYGVAASGIQTGDLVMNNIGVKKVEDVFYLSGWGDDGELTSIAFNHRNQPQPEISSMTTDLGAGAAYGSSVTVEPGGTQPFLRSASLLGQSEARHQLSTGSQTLLFDIGANVATVASGEFLLGSRLINKYGHRSSVFNGNPASASYTPNPISLVPSAGAQALASRPANPLLLDAEQMNEGLSLQASPYTTALLVNLYDKHNNYITTEFYPAVTVNGNPTEFFITPDWELNIYKAEFVAQTPTGDLTGETLDLQRELMVTQAGDYGSDVLDTASPISFETIRTCQSTLCGLSGNAVYVLLNDIWTRKEITYTYNNGNTYPVNNIIDFDVDASGYAYFLARSAEGDQVYTSLNTDFVNSQTSHQTVSLDAISGTNTLSGYTIRSLGVTNNRLVLAGRNSDSDSAIAFSPLTQPATLVFDTLDPGNVTDQANFVRHVKGRTFAGFRHNLFELTNLETTPSFQLLGSTPTSGTSTEPLFNQPTLLDQTPWVEFLDIAGLDGATDEFYLLVGSPGERRGSLVSATLTAGSSMTVTPLLGSDTRSSLASSRRPLSLDGGQSISIVKPSAGMDADLILAQPSRLLRLLDQEVQPIVDHKTALENIEYGVWDSISAMAFHEPLEKALRYGPQAEQTVVARTLKNQLISLDIPSGKVFYNRLQSDIRDLAYGPGNVVLALNSQGQVGRVTFPNGPTPRIRIMDTIPLTSGAEELSFSYGGSPGRYVLGVGQDVYLYDRDLGLLEHKLPLNEPVVSLHTYGNQVGLVTHNGSTARFYSGSLLQPSDFSSELISGDFMSMSGAGPRVYLHFGEPSEIKVYNIDIADHENYAFSSGRTLNEALQTRFFDNRVTGKEDRVLFAPGLGVEPLLILENEYGFSQIKTFIIDDGTEPDINVSVQHSYSGTAVFHPGDSLEFTATVTPSFPVRLHGVYNSQSLSFESLGGGQYRTTYIPSWRDLDTTYNPDLKLSAATPSGQTTHIVYNPGGFLSISLTDKSVRDLVLTSFSIDPMSPQTLAYSATVLNSGVNPASALQFSMQSPFQTKTVLPATTIPAGNSASVTGTLEPTAAFGSSYDDTRHSLKATVRLLAGTKIQEDLTPANNTALYTPLSISAEELLEIPLRALKKTDFTNANLQNLPSAQEVTAQIDYSGPEPVLQLQGHQPGNYNITIQFTLPSGDVVQRAVKLHVGVPALQVFSPKHKIAFRPSTGMSLVVTRVSQNRSPVSMQSFSSTTPDLNGVLFTENTTTSIQTEAIIDLSSLVPNQKITGVVSFNASDSIGRTLSQSISLIATELIPLGRDIEGLGNAGISAHPSEPGFAVSWQLQSSTTTPITPLPNLPYAGVRKMRAEGHASRPYFAGDAQDGTARLSRSSVLLSDGAIASLYMRPTMAESENPWAQIFREGTASVAPETILTLPGRENALTFLDTLATADGGFATLILGDNISNEILSLHRMNSMGQQIGATTVLQAPYGELGHDAYLHSLDSGDLGILFQRNDGMQKTLFLSCSPDGSSCAPVHEIGQRMSSGSPETESIRLSDGRLALAAGSDPTTTTIDVYVFDPAAPSSPTTWSLDTGVADSPLSLSEDTIHQKLLIGHSMPASTYPTGQLDALWQNDTKTILAYNGRLEFYDDIAALDARMPSTVVTSYDVSSISTSIVDKATSVASPWDIWSDGNKVLIAEHYRGRVLATQWPSSTAPLPVDAILGCDSAGVTSCTLGDVQSVSSDGTRVAIAHQNRVVFLDAWPTTSAITFDGVVGQSDFFANTVGLGNLDRPKVFVGNSGMVITDSGNNRVLGWNSWPASQITSIETADWIVGQPDFASDTPGSGSGNLDDPQDFQYDSSSQLAYINDVNNHRVLVYDFNTWPVNGTHSILADTVLGSPDFAESPQSLEQIQEIFEGAIDMHAGGNRLMVPTLSDIGSRQIYEWRNVSSGLANGKAADSLTAFSTPSHHAYTISQVDINTEAITLGTQNLIAGLNAGRANGVWLIPDTASQQWYVFTAHQFRSENTFYYATVVDQTLTPVGTPRIIHSHVEGYPDFANALSADGHVGLLLKTIPEGGSFSDKEYYLRILDSPDDLPGLQRYTNDVGNFMHSGF